MYPVLFTVFGFPIQTYGVSNALAAIVAGLVLARAFRRHGLPGEVARLVGGAARHVVRVPRGQALLPGRARPDPDLARLRSDGIYLVRRADRGSVVAGLRDRAAGLPSRRRRDLRPPHRSALGHGLPARHGGHHGASAPDPVYEALAAFAIAGLLARVGPRVAAPALFGLYLILSGAARFLVEFLRINEPALLGLIQLRGGS